MDVLFHKRFKKQLQKIPLQVQEKFFERLNIMVTAGEVPQLGIHRLGGDMAEFKSINVTGDYRALFEIKEKNIIIFMKIGTHSELY